MPNNHQHDEVLEKILTKVYHYGIYVAKEKRLYEPDERMSVDKALTALHSYIENEKREARIDEIRLLGYYSQPHRGDPLQIEGISKTREEVIKRLSALRASHDGKEG